MSVYRFDRCLNLMGTISKNEAICDLFLGRAISLAPTGEVFRSPSTVMDVPLAIQMLYGKGTAMRLWFPPTAENVFKRDPDCQYCGAKTRLTIDHVVPQHMFKGGKTSHAAIHFPGLGKNSWENQVACCEDCNNKKGGRTPEQAKMKLRRVPRRPKPGELTNIDFIWEKINAANEASVLG